MIFNARGVYSIPMAEFALCGVLQLYKRSRIFYRSQEDKRWKKCRDILELYGKNVLIVGCGSVGTECAKRFSAFGSAVRGIDLHPREDNLYDVIEPLDRLCDEISIADIIVLTLPLTKETFHLFDAKAMGYVKKGSLLVNISRGAVVDTNALLEALDKGDFLGAVMDVFEDEPLSENSSLWNYENVIITPHNSFVGEGNSKRLNEVILSNLGEKHEKRRNANC